MPRKPASENVLCLCRLLNIRANFSNLFFAYRQAVLTLIRLLLEEQSDLGPHCLQNWLLKSQADNKADDNCCDWQFKDLGGLGTLVRIYAIFVTSALAWMTLAYTFLSVCLFTHPCTYMYPSIHPSVHPKWSLQSYWKTLVLLHWLFYLTELNKDDNSHSLGASFCILVRRWDINFNEVLSIFWQGR